MPLAVLVVEDSPSDSRLLLESLRSTIHEGAITVSVVRRLSDAKVELGRIRFDCVLVDLGLPDGRGTGNVKTICSADPEAAVIVLTGLDSDASAIEALQLGAQDYVVKGQYDPVQLVKRVRLAVQRHRQVSALEARNRSDFQRASQDPLTGLASRKLFEDRAAHLLAQSRRDATPFAIGFVDLDGFKAANDLHGHTFGDDVLRAVGAALAISARGGDTVARIGGDEFALLLLPGIGEFDPVQAASRYRLGLQAIREVSGQAVSVGCSIGVARFPEHGSSVDELIHHSDQAMYEAKRAGGGIVEFGGKAANAAAAVPPPQTAPEPATLRMADAPIVLAYQPWVDAGTGRYAGVEVLARWMEGGRVLSAEEFMAEAERSGLIRDIGRVVMRQAFHHWITLRTSGLDPGTFALNVSAIELLDEDFVPALLSEATLAGVEPFKLRVEIRGNAMADPRSLTTLRRLREAGCSIVLDRFGEDGNDLSTLAELPLDGIKLDRKLLRRLADEGLSGAGRRIVSATLGAAAALNIPAIVAGVESAEDMRLLSFTGARYQQGLWHSRCVTAAELAEQLRQGRPSSFDGLPGIPPR
jgi:diguanylate cyclase (GGDEF)-like protein